MEWVRLADDGTCWDSSPSCSQRASIATDFFIMFASPPSACVLRIMPVRDVIYDTCKM